jgi:hypothetical protein
MQPISEFLKDKSTLGCCFMTQQGRGLGDHLKEASVLHLVGTKMYTSIFMAALAFAHATSNP